MSNGTEKQAQRPPTVAADAEIQKEFSRFDADDDDQISPSELAAVSRAISPLASSSHGAHEAAAMMDELNTDRDSFVDLDEFAAFHARSHGDSELEAELCATFDVDGDGCVHVQCCGSNDSSAKKPSISLSFAATSFL